MRTAASIPPTRSRPPLRSRSSSLRHPVSRPRPGVRLRLERRRLVKREHLESDRSWVMVSLTPTGRWRAATIFPADAAAITAALGALSPTGQATRTPC